MTKATRSQLDLVRNSSEYVEKIRREMQIVTYDVKQIQASFNCTRQQAITLCTMAQIKDAQELMAKAAKK